MVDTKISALPTGTIAGGDYVPFVDDPGGTPATKRQTVGATGASILAAASALSIGGDVSAALAANLDISNYAICFTGTNNSGGAFAKGDVVFLNAGGLDIGLGDADGSSTYPGFGVCAEAIADTASGKVVRLGFITGMNTASWAVNAKLYLTATGTTGNTLSDSPPATGVVQEIGYVVTSHASTGIIFVNPREEGEVLNSGSSFKDLNGNEILEFTVVASAVNHVVTSNNSTGNAPSLKAMGGDTNIDLQLLGKGTGIVKGPVFALPIAISDETTALTTGTAKLTYYMPFAMTLTDIHACVTTAPTGATLIIDVNDGGTSIMTTNKLVIDVSENDTTTAATAPTLTDTALAAGAAITFDIDQVGSTVAGAGAKVTLIGYLT